MTAPAVATTIAVHGEAGIVLTRARTGTLLPALDRRRTVLVLSGDRELAVALRERLDRALVTVCQVWPDEAPAAVRACAPWPWLVVGDMEHVGAELLASLSSRPILLVWRGEPPPGLPAHVAVVRLFSHLVATVEAALGSEVGGMRLAVGSGVTMPDGRHAASPVLEALIASHPHLIALAPVQARAASRALIAHGVGLRVRRGAGGAVLVAEGA